MYSKLSRHSHLFRTLMQGSTSAEPRESSLAKVPCKEVNTKAVLESYFRLNSPHSSVHTCTVQNVHNRFSGHAVAMTCLLVCGNDFAKSFEVYNLMKSVKSKDLQLLGSIA